MLSFFEKLANARNGNSKYFRTVASASGNKADKSTTYTKTQADVLLGAKVDDVDMANYALTSTTYNRTVVGHKFTNIINGAPGHLAFQTR